MLCGHWTDSQLFLLSWTVMTKTIRNKSKFWDSHIMNYLYIIFIFWALQHYHGDGTPHLQTGKGGLFFPSHLSPPKYAIHSGHFQQFFSPGIKNRGSGKEWGGQLKKQFLDAHPFSPPWSLTTERRDRFVRTEYKVY